MTHWWRAYDDAIDHPKLLKLSDAMHRAWWTLQCVASANGGALPPAADIALRLRMKPSKVALWIAELVNARLIDNCDGVFRPHNWDDRQFISDSSTERVKRHRDKKRNVSSHVTGNVSETSNGTAPEQSRADSEAEQSRATARALDEIGLKNEAVLTASFTAVCSSLGRKPPDLRPIRGWLLDGIGMGTIQSAVTPILKRKADMASLTYCDAAVREAHGKAQSAPTLEPVPLSDDDWRSTIARYKSNRSLWSRHAGPEPGMAGCRCPIQVLVDALLDPETGFDMDEHWSFVSEGTVEMAAFIHDAQCRKARPPRMYEIEISGVVKRGFYSQRAFPKGYDEATGERLPPETEDAA
jgi:hypothetical protein